MSQDIKALRSCGVSSDAYKAHFSVPLEDMKPKHKKLVELISGRIKDGRTTNLKEWRAYHAIDLAMDVPFQQTTPTLLQHILSRHYEKPDDLISDLRAYGLDERELFLKVPTPQGETLVLNPPVFFNIFVPLVKAYTTIRCANLFNERNTNPFTPYEPAKETERNRVLCEIVTDMENEVATQFGYPAVLRQAIQQVLRYGVMLAFPREEWYCEQRLDSTERFNAAGKPIFRKVTVKEGLRYNIPHPTFMWYDLNFPLTTINTDTGLEWAMYWHVTSWGSILDNKLYWNRKKIFAGTNWFQSPLAGNLFTEIFPCQLKHPNPNFAPMSREEKAAWYTSGGDRDQSVFLTEFYIKLKPKTWELANYDYPVWHRFTLAGDDTVIFAEPCAYNPIWFMGYDYNENDGRTSSMGLECLPWQDWLGNILSQMMLTARQNLTNVIFYDNQMVDATDIRKMEDLGESRYKQTHFIGYDSIKTRVQGLAAQQAFTPVALAKTAITEFLQMVPTMISIMERVLQVSAQESGAQATHQQSKAEVMQTGGASTQRVRYTGSYVDEGIDAWKQQRFDASMAYRDAGVSAQVSADIADVHRLLEELGFTVQHDGKDKLLVHGQKGNLKLTSFARASEGAMFTTDKEAAGVIFQVCASIASQPLLFQEIGAKNVRALLEFGARLGGAPRGWKLKGMEGGDSNAVPDNVLGAIQQAQQATLSAVQERIGQPAAQAVAQVQGEVQQMQQMLQQLQKIYDVAAKTQDKNQIAAEQAATKAQIKEAEAQQKQAHKAQELSQKEREFQAEQERKNIELASDLERKRIESEASIQLARREAAAKAAAKPDSAPKTDK